MKQGAFLIEENVPMSGWQGVPALAPLPSPSPAPQEARKRIRLQSVGDVADELAKLYREARSKRLDVADASRLANMLSILSRILETSELEKRVAELEQRGSMH